MPRIAIINMLIGFCAIFFAAAAGSFIANDTTIAVLKNKELLTSWQMMLIKSAHGHTNLFGFLHIAFGLTIPYSKFSNKIKKYQTAGLACGTIAMSVLMLMKSYSEPSFDLKILDMGIGVMLSATLAALAAHCFGLYGKLLR